MTQGASKEVRAPPRQLPGGGYTGATVFLNLLGEALATENGHILKEARVHTKSVYK